MQPDGSVYLHSVGTYLPEGRVDGRRAVADGRLTEEEAREADYESVAVEPSLWPADMAVLAARRALDASRVGAEDLRLILANSVHRHGHTHFWSMAPYVQRKLEAVDTLSLSLQGGCASQVASFELALPYLRAGSDRAAVLVVSADRIEESPACRWSVDYGIFFGDGAAACLLSRVPGFARVLAVRSRTVSELEELHRRREPHPERADTLGIAWDVRTCKREYLARYGRDAIERAAGPVVRALFDEALAEAGVDAREVRRFALPHLGRRLLEHSYFALAGFDPARTTWSFGRTVGHVGPADQMLGLEALARSREVADGDHVVLVGAGAGFTLSVVVLRIEDVSMVRRQTAEAS